MEINDCVVKKPELLCKAVRVCILEFEYYCMYSQFVQPLGEGYIAIVLPKLAESENVCSH